MSHNTLKRRSWGYPDCPSCATDVFVDEATEPRANGKTYRCHWCGSEWT